jgi:hypothetical protein
MQMTEGEWKTLFEIVRKAEINGRMGLNDNELQTLKTYRKKLRFHERVRLSSRWDRAAVGTVWHDFGEISDSGIELDDQSSREREERPYAYIWQSTGYYRIVETVDIIESIARNPTSIGHPAIIFAIYHWQEVIQAQRLIERDDVYSHSDMGKAVKRELGGGKELEIAKRNLKAVTDAFHSGIKEKRLSKEVAFANQVKSMSLDDQDNFLYEAWKRLEARHVEQTDETLRRLEKIESHLQQIEREYPNHNTDTPIRKVMDFLRADGVRFVYSEESEFSRRPTWKAFRHAFLAWHFDMKQTTVQEYLEEAARHETPEVVYRPSLSAPKGRVANIFHYVLAIPLVSAREPLVVHEDDIGFHGLTAAIEDLEKHNQEPN